MKFLAFCLLIVSCLSSQALTATNQQDVDALNALREAWSPSSLSWTGDPCNNAWVGITCDATETVVVKLILPNMGISGIIPAQIGALINLQVLDLSFNGNLTGYLPNALFLLSDLSQLFLQFCGLFGMIPEDLGRLTNLTYLALNNNNFAGPIPTSIGQLSKLFWFDISSNQFTDNLPATLSQLTAAKHFHFQENNFSGVIPTGIFTSNMTLIHLLLNNNSFTGAIPDDISTLSELDILRLDFNQFSSISSGLTQLTTISTVQVNHNNLSGPMPDLSNLTNLQILSLGHNRFTTGPIPPWLVNIPHLQSIDMEATNRDGEVPPNLFSLSNLSDVFLGFNSLSGTLNLQQAGPNMAQVDLEQNLITDLQIRGYSGELNLKGNLACNDPNQPDNACNPTSGLKMPLFPTSACGCSMGFGSNPTAPSGTCLCSYPVTGVIIFIALKVTLDSRLIPTLQSGFAKNISLISSDKQVYISIVSNAMANISIYPNNARAWDASQANLITALLSSKAISLPSVGPYEYLPFGPYIPPGSEKGGFLSGAVKAGIIVGVLILALVIASIGSYAFIQKRRADKAEVISKPFATWMTNGEDKVAAPRVKGARLFLLSEIKKATNNFSKRREIGAGGYGKVYKGILPSQEQVAIKRASPSSHQGANEFKNEIELLSRVHHKNLVSLLGFCFEEQMLVYEYVPNGTLRDALSGHSNVKLNWQRRLQIALGSARGLAYLHTEANPPIIHRDIKSSNILLDKKLVAKVADFGLSKLAPEDGDPGKRHVSTQVKGTLGYLDPEYYTTQRLTEKSDVYSFGVVLLELLTAKQPIQHGKFIVHEVRDALQKGGISAFECLLDDDLSDCPTSELKVFLQIALRCVEEASSARPTMKQAAKELENLVSTSLQENSQKLAETQKYESTYANYIDESSFEYSGHYDVPVIIEPK